MQDVDFCKEHFSSFFVAYRPSLRHAYRPSQPLDKFVRLDVELVAISFESDVNQLISLRQRDAARRLHILTGTFEASVVAWYFKGERSARPLTHEVFKRTIEALGGKVESVRIDGHDDVSNIFLAKLDLEREDRPVSIEIRPSDGICLALISDAPIYARESMLEEVPGSVDT